MGNSCVALGIELKEMAQLFDSISICMSKGMAAPMGSMLVGTTSFIKEARKYRKMIGGGMRQSGVMSQQALIGLQNWK
jgi:threonine aldolase